MKPTAPFSEEYVLRETVRKMLVAIAVSTQKTLARLPEFAEDEDKKQEIMRTLASLNELDKMMKSVREVNRL